MDQVVEAKQTCGNRLRRGAQPISVELLKELLHLTAILIFFHHQRNWFIRIWRTNGCTLTSINFKTLSTQ